MIVEYSIVDGSFVSQTTNFNIRGENWGGKINETNYRDEGCNFAFISKERVIKFIYL